MASRVEFTREAARDIEEIGRFTQERWGAAQRVAYLRGLERKMEQLGKRPKLGVRREEIAPGHRSARYGRHVIFYRESGRGILVSRVVHVSMDLRARLTGPDERG